MSLSNNNVLYIPVPPDNSNGLNIVQELSEAQPQGQFPTYNTSIASQPRVSQVLSVSDKALDNTTGKSPAKQTAVGSSAKSAQQLYAQKNEMNNDSSLIHPRGSAGEDDHRISSQDSSGNNRGTPNEGHVNQSPYTDSASYSQQHHHQQQHQQQHQHQHQQQHHDSSGRVYHQHTGKKSHVVH